jgi:hypothetical protein
MASDNAFLIDVGEPVLSDGGVFLAIDGFVSVVGGGRDAPIRFRMRAFDQTLGRTVYWTARVLDYEAKYYDGPGPLINIRVFKVIPGKNV